MPIAVSVKTVADDLQDLLAQLPWGETMTLVDEGGEPLALLVSLKTKPISQVESGVDWEARWDALAKKISAAWIGDKSAVETLIEMRR
jgi:hypothetical protein